MALSTFQYLSLFVANLQPFNKYILCPFCYFWWKQCFPLKNLVYTYNKTIYSDPFTQMLVKRMSACKTYVKISTIPVNAWNDILFMKKYVEMMKTDARAMANRQPDLSIPDACQVKRDDLSSKINYYAEALKSNTKLMHFAKYWKCLKTNSNKLLVQVQLQSVSICL